MTDDDRRLAPLADDVGNSKRDAKYKGQALYRKHGKRSGERMEMDQGKEQATQQDLHHQTIAHASQGRHHVATEDGLLDHSSYHCRAYGEQLEPGELEEMKTNVWIEECGSSAV